MFNNIKKIELNKVNNNTSLNSKVQERGYVDYFDKKAKDLVLMLALNYLVDQLEVIKRKVMKLNLKRNMEMLN